MTYQLLRPNFRLNIYLGSNPKPSTMMHNTNQSSDDFGKMTMAEIAFAFSLDHETHQKQQECVHIV